MKDGRNDGKELVLLFYPKTFVVVVALNLFVSARVCVCVFFLLLLAYPASLTGHKISQTPLNP